jgi:glutamine amidotransferase
VIAIVDYGMGNRRSVEKALEHVGARRGSRATTTSSARPTARRARRRRLPGGDARLRALGLDELLRERGAAGVPAARHLPRHAAALRAARGARGRAGSGCCRATVTALARPAEAPHIGWNEVTLERPSALTEGFGATASFYHVHSYAARPDDDADVVGRGEYGERFVSIAERGTIMGAQFHPEKSSRNGLALLRNFTRVCDRVAA